ncbi:rhodopsin-like [Physella acuta]|uniref:rhodopsin-like n=1 Tax=Physella acuta TaxID=109671 RepID=UPI0027DDB536|nr:rhodopsin-like [Physella acuta]
MADTNPTDHDEMMKKLVEETREFLVPDLLLRNLMLSLSVILHGVISLAGVLSNSVNVLVFIRLGLKDSMSVGLWALSFTDLVVTACQLAACVCYLIAYVYPNTPISPWSIGSFVLGSVRYVGYFISCWITTIIALERCYCVVAPFRVKLVFTKSRCVASITFIYIIHVGIVIPLFIYDPMEWVLYTTGEKDANSSLIYFMQFQWTYTQLGAQWDTIVNIVEGVVLSCISQVLILFCTFWMVFSLKTSSKIRNQSALKEMGDNHEKSDNLSSRERRLVKVVILLAIIQTVCSVPRFMVTAVYHIFPGCDLGAYDNLMTLIWEMSYIFSTICCTSNIFVYLKLNANFRQQSER